MNSSTPPVQETWNSADLFADDDAWEGAREALAARLEGLERWRGRLASGADVLADALQQVTEAHERLALLRCYATLRADEDTRVGRYQAMRQTVELLTTDLAARISYLRPEILALDPELLERFIGGEPCLEPHRFFLRDLIRQRAHVLGPSEERLMSMTGLMSGAPSSLYELLSNAELPRPEIVLTDGARVRLTPVNFHQHRTTQNRADRLALFPAYFGAYAAFRDTLGHNLSAAVKSHLFRARARGYPSCLAAALDADHVPVRVYTNLIRQVREHLPVLHRYFRLRAAALGVDRLDYADLHCPLCPSPPARYTPAQTRSLLQASLAPLGRTYADALHDALGSRWIDWHPAPGKRAGAYATGWAYSVHPFVLLNFTGDFESVSTAAHEMGHAMHSFFSNRAQPFATAAYSIFVAEVASTLNEALLSWHLLQTETAPQQRLFLLGTYLDAIRGTLFRQTMFAEFELEIHARVERGEALTGETLNTIYLELLRQYHGHDAGVVHVDEAYAVEWAAVPHFYYNFYVYQYTTGIVAATALARSVLQDGAAAVGRYLDFLSAGGSDYPLALLRRAGVDLERAEPYDSAMGAVEARLDDLERLLGSR